MLHVFMCLLHAVMCPYPTDQNNVNRNNASFNVLELTSHQQCVCLMFIGRPRCVQHLWESLLTSLPCSSVGSGGRGVPAEDKAGKKSPWDQKGGRLRSPVLLITWSQAEEQRMETSFWLLLSTRDFRGYQLCNLIYLKTFLGDCVGKKPSEQQGRWTWMFPDWRISTRPGNLDFLYTVAQTVLLFFCLSCLNECARKGHPPTGLLSHYQSCLGFYVCPQNSTGFPLGQKTADCHKLTTST